MRIRDGLLPDRLYCWLFEHDDSFVHEIEPDARHYWCQRCFVRLPPVDQ
jgi:hypothetical protein